jgi:hypothetical protein
MSMYIYTMIKLSLEDELIEVYYRRMYELIESRNTPQWSGTPEVKSYLQNNYRLI